MDESLSDADAYIAADNQFHRALAKATKIPHLILIDSIVNPLSEQRKHIFAVDGGPERGQFHHRRILESIIRRILRTRAQLCAPTCNKFAKT